MTLLRCAALALSVAIVFGLAGPVRAQGEALQEANRLFKQGQLDRALDRVDAYLANNPKDARGRFMKGLILAEQNKPAEAIKVFTSLTEDFPELPEPYNNLAVLYASQGQYEKARTALEMAIRTHPSYATAHENLGDIYAKMASQAYDKALQLDRGNTAAQTKLNLIRDLFTGSARPAAAAKAAPSTKVAAAPQPAPAPAATATPQPAATAPAAAAKPQAAPAPAPTQVATAEPPPAKPAPEVKPSAPARPSTEGKPAPAAKPAPAPAAKPAAPVVREEDVIKAVNDWAKAWSDNDVPGYLAHYAPDFETPKGMSRAEWEAQRKARIAKPREIEVQIDSPKVKFEGDSRAVVTFRQRYRSNTFKADATKKLTLVRSGAKWLIQQEDVGG